VEFKSQFLNALRRRQPTVFRQLVRDGEIEVFLDGAARDAQRRLDEIVAERGLDRADINGMRMAEEVVIAELIDAIPINANRSPSDRWRQWETFAGGARTINVADEDDDDEEEDPQNEDDGDIGEEEAAEILAEFERSEVRHDSTYDTPIAEDDDDPFGRYEDEEAPPFDDNRGAPPAGGEIVEPAPATHAAGGIAGLPARTTAKTDSRLSWARVRAALIGSLFVLVALGALVAMVAVLARNSPRPSASFADADPTLVDYLEVCSPFAAMDGGRLLQFDAERPGIVVEDVVAPALRESAGVRGLMRLADKSGSPPRSDPITSGVTGTYEVHSGNRVSLHINGAVQDYVLLEPLAIAGDGCILSSGPPSAADLTRSWFGSPLPDPRDRRASGLAPEGRRHEWAAAGILPDYAGFASGV
jgi:hypothetical protein